MKLSFFLVLIAFSTSCLHAQTDSTRRAPVHSLGVIDTIIIVGNEKTKDIIILREMTLKPGSNTAFEVMEYDKGRIYSTGLFTRVEMQVFPIEGKNALLVDVSERWYIIPLPLFGFREGDTKKPYYGAGLLHNNFRGLNQKLYGAVVFGYNPSLALSFSDPVFDRENDLYFSTSLSYSKVRNRSELATAGMNNFDELHYDAFVTLGKRFTIYENVGISLGYQIIDVSEKGPERTISSNGIDRFLSGAISYSYDSRNLPRLHHARLVVLCIHVENRFRRIGCQLYAVRRRYPMVRAVD